LSNLLKKDLSTIYNYNVNNNNNSKTNDYNLNIERTKIEEKDKEIENPKKSDKIIVINNGTFMNEGTVNGSSNKKVNITLRNANEKRKTIKGNDTIKEELRHENSYNKTLTYNKKHKNKESMIRGSIINPKNSSNIIHSYSRFKILDGNNSEKNETVDHGSKQKIIDTSSINLLNVVNKTKNFYFSNSNNNLMKKKRFTFA
jgi:hypothetical protein